jgi:lysophospholipase L1-like esterase
VAPSVLSIFIGINDVWHGLAFDRVGCDIDRYVTGYRDILDRTRAELPECKLVLCEPSVISPPAHDEGNAKLQPYVRAVHELAASFGVSCVLPLHRAFIDAQTSRPDVRWTSDGVHPTSTGHMLIARTWLEATGLLD